MAWQLCWHGMCKIFKRYDTLQWSDTKTNFPSNLNYHRKSVREMGCWYYVFSSIKFLHIYFKIHIPDRLTDFLYSVRHKGFYYLMGISLFLCQTFPPTHLHAGIIGSWMLKTCHLHFHLTGCLFYSRCSPLHQYARTVARFSPARGHWWSINEKYTREKDLLAMSAAKNSLKWLAFVDTPNVDMDVVCFSVLRAGRIMGYWRTSICIYGAWIMWQSLWLIRISWRGRHMQILNHSWIECNSNKCREFKGIHDHCTCKCKASCRTSTFHIQL